MHLTKSLSSQLFLYLSAGIANAQLPSVWHPNDAVTYFCQRWYHQCPFLSSTQQGEANGCVAVVKHDVLYIHGGIQTFNLPEQANWTNSTLGYSMYAQLTDYLALLRCERVPYRTDLNQVVASTHSENLHRRREQPISKNFELEANGKTDQFLLSVDLRDTWNRERNLTYMAFEEQPDQTTGHKVRDAMIMGTIFHGLYNDSNIYTYGGTTFRGNESFPKANTSFDYSENDPLWSVDTGTQVWKPYDIQQRAWTPSHGAAAEASDQGLAFYLSGRIDNGTASFTSQDGDVQTLLDGMTILNIAEHESRDVSTNGIGQDQPRIGGALQYVPGIGNNGILVALGGRVFGGPKRISSQDKGYLLRFDSVDVFDIGSYLNPQDPGSNGTWYSQSTSGDIPPSRIDFCAIVTSAPDNSSHNIWIHGGQDPTMPGRPSFFDDVYVLSLPSFTWIKVYQGSRPRWGHTCHLAGGNQLLSVGGHNEDENTCDSHTVGMGILDLARMVWTPVFHANGNSRDLNYKIPDRIGGSVSGGATKVVPEIGWANKEFGDVMGTKRDYDNINGTIALQQRETLRSGVRNHKAIIAGASIGGTVLITSMSLLACVYRRRRRSMKATASNGHSGIGEMEDSRKIELQGNGNICEVDGSACRIEISSTAVLAEADSSSQFALAVELPTVDFENKGRRGESISRTHSLVPLRSTSNHSWFEGDDSQPITITRTRDEFV